MSPACPVWFSTPFQLGHTLFVPRECQVKALPIILQGHLRLFVLTLSGLDRSLQLLAMALAPQSILHSLVDLRNAVALVVCSPSVKGSLEICQRLANKDQLGFAKNRIAGFLIESLLFEAVAPPQFLWHASRNLLVEYFVISPCCCWDLLIWLLRDPGKPAEDQRTCYNNLQHPVYDLGPLNLLRPHGRRDSKTFQGCLVLCALSLMALNSRVNKETSKQCQRSLAFPL